MSKQTKHYKYYSSQTQNLCGTISFFTTWYDSVCLRISTHQVFGAVAGDLAKDWYCKKIVLLDLDVNFYGITGGCVGWCTT